MKGIKKVSKLLSGGQVTVRLFSRKSRITFDAKKQIFMKLSRPENSVQVILGRGLRSASLQGTALGQKQANHTYHIL
jgi:hypothetical protein